MSTNRRRTYIYGGDDMKELAYIRDGDYIYDIKRGTQYLMSDMAGYTFVGYCDELDQFYVTSSSSLSVTVNVLSNCDELTIGDNITSSATWTWNLCDPDTGEITPLIGKCYYYKGHCYGIFAASSSSICDTYLYEYTIGGEITKILNLGLTDYQSDKKDQALFRFDSVVTDEFGYYTYVKYGYVLFRPRYRTNSDYYYPSNEVWVVNVDTFELGKYVTSTNISVGNLNTPDVAFSSVN